MIPAMLPVGAVQTTDEIVRAAVNHFGPFIKRFAQSLADVYEDPQLADDLEQEAWVKLWALDPTRFESNDGPYVRAVLRNRMRAVARREFLNAGGSRRESLVAARDVVYDDGTDDELPALKAAIDQWLKSRARSLGGDPELIANRTPVVVPRW